MSKVIKASSFVPGRVYSLIYVSDVDMVGKRKLLNADVSHVCKTDDKGNSLNPLADCRVWVRRVSTVQAAGNHTWENFKRKNDIVTQATTREPWYNISAENDCILIHKTTGVEYLRGLPRGVTKEVYHVGDVEATPAQVAIIQAFKKSTSTGDFIVLTIDKLENVESLENEADESAIAS